MLDVHKHVLSVLPVRMSTARRSRTLLRVPRDSQDSSIHIDRRRHDIRLQD
jgi:hypothetical protein